MHYLIQSRFSKGLLILLLACLTHACKKGPAEEPAFSFAFLTDIHVQPERRATEGFKAAIAEVNRRKPDFVITGGDLIMDALAQKESRADSLYELYIQTSKAFDMPVYNSMGNHEIFGYYPQSGADSSHSLYGDKMFEKKLGKRYQAFDYKGWRFYILDAIDEWEEGGYYGYIDREQMDWLEEDLAGVDPQTPIAICVHIPLVSVFTQLDMGATTPHGRGSVVTNSKEVLELFSERNLKLVLQGHLHSCEDIYVYGIHFITVGAVSGGWWQGTHRGFEEGFLMVYVSGDEFQTEYIDYGWQVDE